MTAQFFFKVRTLFNCPILPKSNSPELTRVKAYYRVRFMLGHWLNDFYLGRLVLPVPPICWRLFRVRQ